MAVGMKYKDNNYIKAYERSKKATTPVKKSFWIVFTLPLILCMMAALYMFIGYQKQALNNELDTLNSFNNDQTNTALYNQAIEQENYFINYLHQKKEDLLGVESVFTATPALSENDFIKFLSCNNNNIVISNLTYDNTLACFSFNAIATDTKAIPEYLDRLRDTEIFDNVAYFGYQWTDTGYSFEITCTIRVVE